MITKFEKRVVAGIMAVLMCFSMLQVPVMNVNAQDMEAEETVVSETVVQEEKTTEAEFNVQEEEEVETEVVAEEKIKAVSEVPDEEIPTIILDQKYSEEPNESGTEAMYKFTPVESGKYVFLTLSNLNMEIYDENWNYIGYYYDDKRIDLSAGQTYYIKMWNSAALEWSLTKALEVELQVNTKYEILANQAVNYRFVPEQSTTYLFNLENPATCTVYDSNWSTVTYGSKAALAAGETYYIVIIPREEVLNWEVEMCEAFGEYSYRIQKDGTIEIMGYLGTESSISIPESIEGIEVTNISAGAFFRNTIIEEVFIPACVKEVSGSAFSNCENLKKVEFAPDSKLEKIGVSAFSYCSKLSNVILPNGVKELGSSVFSSSGLVEIDIPDSVIQIGNNAFFGCYSLQKVSIGKGLKYISCQMFWNCSKLEKIDFMKSGISNVTRIEYDAFGFCGSLQDIKFPESVKSMGANSMMETGWYNSQNEGMLYLDQILYGYKGEIAENTDVIVQDGTTVIADRAFMRKQGIKSIELADTVTNIGKFSFYDCGLVQSVTIPKNVVEIGKFAFGYIEGNENDGQLVSEEWFSTYVKKMEDFTIQGYSGTAAEKYAKDNGFEFVSLGSAEPVKEFKDVAKTDWFYDAAMYVSSNGIMGGLTADTFGPMKTLTRAQFATILYQLGGKPAVEYTKKFSDIPKGQWYTDGVLWANSIGVVGGYNNGTFGPNNNITREQMSLMMYNYAKYKGYDTSKTADISSYSDASKVNNYAQEALKWAVGNQIIGGKAGNKLDPQGKATRAECAVIMMQFVEKNEK